MANANNNNVSIFSTPSEIYDTIDMSVQLVYCAVGCSMKNYVTHENINHDMIEQGYHRMITPTNNQQFPLPLHSFNGKKVFILIDPEMENVPHVTNMLGLPQLGMAPTFSVFGNENTTVFSIKEYIIYNDPSYELYNEHLQFIFNLITYFLARIIFIYIIYA